MVLEQSKPVEGRQKRRGEPPVFKILKRMVEVTTAIPHERTSERILERIVDVLMRGAVCGYPCAADQENWKLCSTYANATRAVPYRNPVSPTREHRGISSTFYFKSTWFLLVRPSTEKSRNFLSLLPQEHIQERVTGTYLIFFLPPIMEEVVQVSIP